MSVNWNTYFHLIGCEITYLTPWNDFYAYLTFPAIGGNGLKRSLMCPPIRINYRKNQDKFENTTYPIWEDVSMRKIFG